MISRATPAARSDYITFRNDVSRARNQKAFNLNEAELDRQRKRIESLKNVRKKNMEAEEEQIRKQIEKYDQERSISRGIPHHRVLPTIEKDSLLPEGSSKNTPRTKTSAVKEETKSRLFDFKHKEGRSLRELKSCPSPHPEPALEEKPSARILSGRKKSQRYEVREAKDIIVTIDPRFKSRKKKETDTRRQSLAQAFQGAHAQTAASKEQQNEFPKPKPLTAEHKENTSGFKGGKRSRSEHHDENQERRSSLGTSMSKERRGSKTGSIPSVHITGGEDHVEKLQNLYNYAIKTVASVNAEPIDEEGVTLPPVRQKSQVRPGKSSGMVDIDLATLKELEEILKEAKAYTDRSDLRDNAETAGSTKVQKKRIENLERIVQSLKPREYKTVTLDPREILSCSYLRLSRSNIASLEEQIQSEGDEPGIHVHKDVKEHNIWDGLKEDRADLAVPKGKNKTRKMSARGNKGKTSPSAKTKHSTLTDYRRESATPLGHRRDSTTPVKHRRESATPVAHTIRRTSVTPVA